VPGIRCREKVRSPKSEVRGQNRPPNTIGGGILSPESWLLSPALKKMKVTPGMLMKTKDGRKWMVQESGLRAGIGGLKIHDSRRGANMPYDGISPEVSENKESMVPKLCVRTPNRGETYADETQLSREQS
jgi:hypothetical protein